MKHFYIFYINDGKNFYERTCGSKKSANERVEYLKTIYENAIWFNNIPKDYNYFY